MKVGDTVHVIANFKPYIERVWVDWGATFVGAPILDYAVTGGSASISYTPPSGSLPTPYETDLSIKISRMQSITNAGAGPYFSAPSWSRVIKENQAGFQIAADLNPPSMFQAWDLYYDSSLPLRFSPSTALLDGYNTQPNNFDIYLKLPGWGDLGGPTQFTLRFASENRELFEKTYSLLDSPISVIHLGGGVLKVSWDGKNAGGNIIGPNALTTMGITLVDVKDFVGNAADINHITGDEFPPGGDMTLPVNHHLINDGGMPHIGTTIVNRIHVVLDGVAPDFLVQPEFTDETAALGSPVTSLDVVRLINDVNNNGVWDPAEAVFYNYGDGDPAGSEFLTRFQTYRSFTVDTNDLRHENHKYWYVVERDGGTPAEKWFWDGTGWLNYAGFDQDMHSIDIPFPPSGSNSNIVSIPWDLGMLSSTLFPGSDTGVLYKATVYIQDNAGNITKAGDDLEINISEVYMNIPTVETVNVISEHITGVGGLPVDNAGTKNFYLTSTYDDDPSYSGPHAGTYYNTQDEITFEVMVNDRNFLRATDSVEFSFQQLGISAPQTRYIQRSEFGADNKATITLPADIIPIAAGNMAPGILWGVGGANNPSNYIQVTSHAIEYTVGGVPFNQSFPAIGADAIYLVIPPAPIYPDPDWTVYNLAASEEVFSPGNPLNTYDAVFNPANDNMKDITDLSFTIPTGDNIAWKLEVSKDLIPVREWTGNLGVGETPFAPLPFTYDGLSSILEPAVGALETSPLTVTLFIEPEPMADPGYVDPPAGIYPNMEIVVDNTNPKLINGAGTSIVENTRTIDLDGPTPVVTELENSLNITLYTNESLTDNFGAPGTWQVKLVDEYNNPIMNGGSPVAATVTSVLASGDYQTFNLQVLFNGLAGTVTHENAKLIVMLPWDDASNPGRYNTPSYPYNADVWHRDSAEYYLNLNILDGKPRIDDITFEYRGVTGLANNSSGTWNPAVDQGYVGPTIAGQQGFTLTATVSGGAYRAMYSTWSADLRPLLGSAAANAAVQPSTVTPIGGPTPNEAIGYTLVWNGTIPNAVSNAWVHNNNLSIPIKITTEDLSNSNPIAHQEAKNIVVKIDKQVPTANNSTTAIVADGNNKAMNFTVTDVNAGVDWASETLTLNPNTGMNINDVGNGQWTVSIPLASSVKHFTATYTVKDLVGNSYTLTRYINVDPVPHLTNVKINNDTAYFVPGTDLTVTWDLDYAQRATGGQLVLTSSVAITGGTVNLTPAQLTAGTYTFNNFYNNNTALDNKNVTATVTGYTTGYASATSSTTSNRAFTYGSTSTTDNVDTIIVDSKPVITAVKFKSGSQEINTLTQIPDMSGLTIEATVTSINNLDPNPTITMISPTGTLTGIFDWVGNPVITAAGNTKTITWSGVSFTNLNWTPVSDLKVARFNVNTQTVYGYDADQYMHDMAIMKKPVALIQGKTGRAAYDGTDPDGWFAPEHVLHTEYTFVTTVNAPTVPPIKADYDLIEDNITDNWRDPQNIGSGSTKTTLTQSLVRGRNISNTINVSTYKYMAKWVINPDVQSVWNAYDDGEAIDIFFDYTQMTGQESDTWNIKVDKKVPVYDDFVWVATGTTTPTSYQALQNGFPGPSADIDIALNPNGTWPAGQKIYLKYVAMDGIGAGVLDVATPVSPQSGWAVAQVAHTVNADGTVEKVISLTPVTPTNVNGNSTLSLTLGTVQDAVGHLNYGGPLNSTDPNWVDTPPVLNFKFRADFVTSHEMLRAYKYQGTDTPAGRQDWQSSPYVQAGAPIGVMLKLNPIAKQLTRGADVQDITVSSVELNTRYITNVSGGVDAWVTLAKDPVTDIYYLDTNRIVNTSYAHNAGISMQYRINYLITYTDFSTSVPAPFVSAVLPNVAMVDKEVPQFIYDGSPTDPANQRSIFYWSESIGSAQEGYVVPGDTNGQLRLIFKDNHGYENPDTVPEIVISGLDQFVTGMPVNYTVSAPELSYQASYSLEVNGNTYTYSDVWVAALDNMAIYAQATPIFSATIAYAITDVVGNGPIVGDRMVEIAADGPIVPIIREARLQTVVPGTGNTVYNYLAQSVPATMQIFIDAEHDVYIEDAWIDAVTGVAYGSKTAPVLVDAATHLVAGIPHDLWLVTIPVTPNSVNSYDDIDFVVHTKRNPFGAQVFTANYTVPVIVDGKDYALDSTVVTGISSSNSIVDMLSPNAGATIVANFDDIGELIVANGVDALPTAIEDWFVLQNETPEAFVNIPDPTLAINGKDVVATWTFDANDINQALAAGVNQLAFTLQYQNIWGLQTSSAAINFDFDQHPPVISADGITFYEGDDIVQTDNYDAANYIANNLNWTKVRFSLNDPELRAGVAGSGIEDITVNLDREAETYTPNPDPLQNMTANYNVAGDYIELAFNAGFSAFDLAEGYYNFTLDTIDGLDNDVQYVQRLLYWHQPSQMEIVPEHLSTVNLLDADGNIADLQITAFPYDPDGQVQAVEFFLYEDVNNNGIYEAAIDNDVTADLTNEGGQPIDTQAPYTAMWNFDAPHYKYLVDPVYDRDASRQFLLRASSISEGGRAVTDSIVVINVVDNQPPVPNVPVITGNQTFDYITTANNVLSLSVTVDPIWIDAEKATFIINDSDGNAVTSIDADFVGFVANADWDYNGQLPGVFTVSVTATDFVGNTSAAGNAIDISIQNPASLISYNMIMTDVQGFNDESVITDGTIYGANNPADAVNNLRLDTEFFINDPLHPNHGDLSLEGIATITFKTRITNNVTGDITVIDLINDTDLQPDYPASGPIAVTPQIINNTVTLFVPDNFYMAAGYDEQDISYEFFVELTPIHPAVLQDHVYTGIRLDYYAPVVAITEATPNITWSQNNEFVVTGDVADVNNITMSWSSDNTTWQAAQDANYLDLPYQYQAVDEEIIFQNWNTAGGSLESLLDYEGAVWVKVTATDARGNTRESAPVELFIDNVAPQTPVTHVAYRTHPDVEAGVAEGTYSTLHALGTLDNEVNNTINVVTSTQGNYGTSTLRIYVDPTQITNTSDVALGTNHDWNNMATWYNGTNDFRPPMRLYHGFSATDDLTNITWTPGALYDHEPWDGLYGFDIPAALIQNEGAHYFILASSDTRGNWEGNFADDVQAFDGTFSYDEKVAAIDLTVNVQNITDVQVEIVAPADNAIVGEWVNMAANVTNNAGNVAVNEVVFQRKVGASWVDMATVANTASSDVYFHLYRKDIPAYDGLPYVPGVHLFVDGVNHGELIWDAASQSWSNTFDLAQGAYNFEYFLDLNNDGIISNLDDNVALSLGGLSMRSIMDPNGFTSFAVTPWVYSLNTEDIADGLYEFRAVPIDAAGNPLFNYVSPSTWLHIDNTAPATAIESIGGVDRIRVALDQNNVDVSYEQLKLAADVNELLVALDDIIEVTYQYSAQVPEATIRQWNDFASSTAMAGNYMVDFAVGLAGGILSPLTDGIDNDADGLVDEADEAEAVYYLRAVARDYAGNYFTSNVIEVTVDGNAPLMQVQDINGELMADTENIFIIPTEGDVTITAVDITPDSFDGPVEAYFEYIYRPTVTAGWSAPQPFDVNDIWQPVNLGTASQILPAALVQEGYFGFRAVARDVLRNINIAAAPYTYVVFDDADGSNARIVSLGANPLDNNNPIDIISYEYAFAQAYTQYNGNINLLIDNPQEINTVTARWAETENGPWVNINTVATNGQANVMIPWTVPVLTRAPYIYLQVQAYDIYANTEASDIVKLYVDTMAPGADVVSFTHSVEPVSLAKVLDQDEDISITLNYTNLPENDLIDVKDVTVRIVKEDGSRQALENVSFTVINSPAHSTFQITAANMATANFDDGIYGLEIELVDFAGNASGIILPADYQMLYIDTTAPANLAITSTSHAGNVAPFDATINFRVDYTDLIGLSDTGALSATFTYQNAADTITDYTLDTVNNWIDFEWNPSQTFEDFIINGEMDIVVNAEVKVTDLLGNEDFVPNTANFFTLTYGVADATKLMVIQDYTIDLSQGPGNVYVGRDHYVNWNQSPAQIAGVLGTSQTEANPQGLDLYAYVAHQAELPAQVSFHYWNTADATNTWTLIDGNAAAQQWNFVNPNFLNLYQSEYHASWNIQNLPTGTYQIKTTSHYYNTEDPAHGSSESIVEVEIYGADSVIAPVFTVDGAIADQVERGETYNLVLDETDPFTGEDDIAAGVVYKYRFVDADNSFSPISQWQYFGNSEGVFEDSWIQGDFSYEWTVYPFYLFNNHIQIVAFAIDQWGTQTQIADALPNAQIVEIINTLAPAVNAISTTWNGIVDPAMISGNVANTATVTASINTSSTPEDLVSVEFFHQFTGEADFVSFDLQEGWAANQMINDLVVTSAAMPIPTAEEVTSVELKVVTTDIYGNTNEALSTVTVENTLPTMDFIVTHEGVELTNELERGITVVLNANPADAPAGVLNVEYFWADASANWTSIDVVDAAPWTLEFVVPQAWEFGATYSLRAVVTDMVTATAGNTLTVDRDFTVTDHSTDIVIDAIAGIAPSSTGIVDPRLHGNIPVAITVNDPAIPRVEFMLRAADADTWTSLKYVDVVVNDASTVFVDGEFDDLDSGSYYLGVRAAVARRQLYPVMADSVMFTLDNDLAVTINDFTPETDSYYNGETFTVEFTVSSDDEINENAVTLEYNTASEPTWMPIAAPATLSSADGIDYVANFTNVQVPVDGYYNFRINVADASIPQANTIDLDVAQNVLFDTGDPIVAMVSINGETDLTLPIDIEMGTQAEIVASAYDVLGGQIHLVASGIEMLEFYSNGEVIGEISTEIRSRELFTFVWNTTGFQINTLHNIHVLAYDRAGNTAATAVLPVNIVAPQALQAYGMITAMEFDADQANMDKLYAVVHNWPGVVNPAVTFEYSNGTDWFHFATGIDRGAYYEAIFNAELMTDAAALRVVIDGNYDANMPQLAVSYNALDHTLETVNPAIAADVFYRNELRVVETFQAAPIVTALQGAAPVMNAPYMMNGNQVVDIAIDAPGIHTFWAAVLDDTGNVQLSKTELETVNAGTATDNGISLTVPAGGFAYFQDVDPAMPVADGFTALSPQHAFFAKDNNNNHVVRELNIAITAPAAEGELVAVYYPDAITGTWSNPMIVTDNEDGTVSVAGVPSGTIVTVLQYTGVGINAMLSSIDPLHSVGANMWTTDAPEIEFFIYEGMDANGYIIPAAVSNVELYLDNVPVAPTAAFDPATGIVGYTAADLAAEDHTIRLVVTQNGFTATAEQTFHVDITEPVITATGSQITTTDRAITATIVDTETGIMDVALVLNGRLGAWLDIPMSSMTVNGNAYTYAITDEDLFTLGHDFSETMALSASWTAENNLEMAVVNPVNVNYTVNIVGPGIVFTGFDNGWWINPTQNTPLTFEVIAPEGREIQDNLMITLEEMINDPVNGNYENLIQDMQLTPVSVNGNVYSYSLNFGYSVAPNAHAIRLSVTAEDSYNVQTESQQTYGIDYLAPVVWALSPVGDAVNPDDFPVTYESAVIPYGTNVAIGVGFQDIQGFVTLETGQWWWDAVAGTWVDDYLVYYTGASGLNPQSVEVTLNGEVITGTVSAGAFMHNAGMLDPGEYTVIATVGDNAGNVGSVSYSFTITGGAPTIAFDYVNGNWWLNSTQENDLGFTVESQNALASGGVVANIYAEPSNMIIQGPITPTPAGNQYNISLLGGIIPAGQYAVRLEVTATDVYGGSSTSNQTYGIDNEAPQITLTTPAENAQFTLNSTVNILASITDHIGTKSAGIFHGRNNMMRTDRAGSGIANVTLKVIAPDGTLALEETYGENTQVVTESLSAAQHGTYTINLSAIDGAGNHSIVSRDFAVIPASGPAVTFNEIAGGWLNSHGINQLGFTVESPVNVNVIANVFVNPADELLMGPLTVNPVSGVYTVAVNGSMIPQDQTSIRLQVMVTDQFNNVTEANEYYGVDKHAPAITILNPAQGAEITLVDETTKVIIEAQFSDLMPGMKSASGSGIAASRMVVIDPYGLQVGAAVETGVGVTETRHEMDNLMLGTYTVRITVWDNAGNQAMESVNFSVVEIPAPPAELEITEAHAYPNPFNADTGAKFSVEVSCTSNVSVRIYDFAGREVRSLDYAGKTNGKSTIEIVFDGRNNDGVKLARGTYFARVIANDGMKIVEKVVKIAIRK
ncbi:MAG: FlgD immunoglobulin-like domain containing protein [Candidatus Cloacimonadaceae bacterium]